MGSGSQRASSRSFSPRLSVRGQAWAGRALATSGKVELVGITERNFLIPVPRADELSRPSNDVYGLISAGGAILARLRGYEFDAANDLERDSSIHRVFSIFA